MKAPVRMLSWLAFWALITVIKIRRIVSIWQNDYKKLAVFNPIKIKY
jgi:hypothetical protein